MAKMKRTRADLVAKIKTARAKAKIKARAYKYLTAKRYGYRRAISAVTTYNEVLSMIEWRGTEQQIPAMAAEATAEFEYERAREGVIPVPKMTLAVMDGRRDALASVTEWMNTKDRLMSRIFLILAWMTVGVWVAATVRTALSPDADLTPIALAFTVALVAIAYKVTQYHEKKSR